MLTERIRGESGYSLVEVMASILILAIAIIPMVGMFDMGLNTAIRGSNYDKARALANLKLEQAKSLPFDTSDDTVQDLKDNFPEPPESEGGTPTEYVDGRYQSGPLDDSDADYWDGYTNFTYEIEKEYIVEPVESVDDPAPLSEPFAPNPTATNPNLIRVTVTVESPKGNTYTTYGLVAK